MPGLLLHSNRILAEHCGAIVGHAHHTKSGVCHPIFEPFLGQYSEMKHKTCTVFFLSLFHIQEYSIQSLKPIFFNQGTRIHYTVLETYLSWKHKHFNPEPHNYSRYKTND